MSNGKDSGGDATADLQDLARRFQDLWRDQMAATMADPEFMEMMGKWMATFSAAGGQQPVSPPAMPPGMFPGMPPGMFPGMPPGMVPGMPPGMVPGAAPGPGGAVDPAAWMTAMQAAMAGAARKGGSDDANTGATPAGATAAADPSGSGDVSGNEFERRLAALEQRMDRLEATLGGAGGGTAKRPRRRKS
jgi:hypothetical protein